MEILPELKEEELRSFFQDHLNDTVGVSVRAGNCPISTFYKEKYGLEIATNRSHITFYFRAPCWETKERENEPWVSSFVRTFDRNYRQPRPVTGAQALAILNRVTNLQEEANREGK
jgi:hypothetical protein